MVPFRFEKEKVIEFWNTIADGKPLLPPADGWSIWEQLQLAAVCFNNAMQNMSRQPDYQELMRLNLGEVDALTQKGREAFHAALMGHTAAAIMVMANLAQQTSNFGVVGGDVVDDAPDFVKGIARLVGGIEDIKYQIAGEDEDEWVSMMGGGLWSE